jgi:hypothetical protein
VSVDVEEQVTVAVPPAVAYEAVRDVRRMGQWSPECFATWVWSSRDGGVRRFVGFNRRGPFVWFTTCRVVVDTRNEEFAFDVTTFGMPVSRWGYRFGPAAGGTEVTEYWQDRRSRGARRMGRIFAGERGVDRPVANREGMRTTLSRLKANLEGGPR